MELEEKKKLLEQKIAYEQFIQVSKDIYKERTGWDYKPRVKKADPEADKDTATAKEVDELLATIIQKKVA